MAQRNAVGSGFRGFGQDCQGAEGFECSAFSHDSGHAWLYWRDDGFAGVFDGVSLKVGNFAVGAIAE
jgi:hypothetical protein